MTPEDLQKKYGEEQVLCLPTESLAPFASGEDPIFYPTEAVQELMKRCGSFQLRWQVEQDASWKQIIPYVVMQTDTEILAARRLQGDPRLVGGYTVGMGGHINPQDLYAENVNDPVGGCVRRELTEETTFDWDRDRKAYQIHPISFVNVRNEVSRMHLCIPIWMQVTDGRRVQIRETDKLQGVWLPKADISTLTDQLEGWSAIALSLLS